MPFIPSKTKKDAKNLAAGTARECVLSTSAWFLPANNIMQLTLNVQCLHPSN